MAEWRTKNVLSVCYMRYVYNVFLKIYLLIQTSQALLSILDNKYIFRYIVNNRHPYLNPGHHPGTADGFVGGGVGVVTVD